MMIKKEVEYEEAPSGNVTFYNYKTPLMRFPEGHGFVGALVFDTDTKKIQCHLCGSWHNVLGNHLHREHAMSADMYKKIVGLNKSTALVNEEVRAKLIAHGVKRGIKTLINQKGMKRSQATRRRIRATLKENRDEQKNLRGTCPEQLIDRLQKLYEKLGHTPRTREIPFYEALQATYGTMKEACMVAGIQYRSPGMTVTKVPFKHSKEDVIKTIHDFLTENGRLPKLKELPKSIYKAISRFGGRQKLYSKALTFDGSYHKQKDIYRYTKEELLDFLKRFEDINGRKPSYSDCKRGLLPHLSRYSYRFGSWKNALQLAFPV